MNKMTCAYKVDEYTTKDMRILEEVTKPASRPY